MHIRESRFRRTCSAIILHSAGKSTVWGTNSPYIVPGLPNNVRRLFCSHPDRSAPHQSISLSGPSVPSPARQRGADVLPVLLFPELPLLPSEGSPLSLIPHGLAVPQPDLTIHHHKVHIGGVSVSNQGFYQVNSRHKAGIHQIDCYNIRSFSCFKEPISSSSPTHLAASMVVISSTFSAGR